MKIDLGQIDNKQTQENFKELKTHFDQEPLLKTKWTYFTRVFSQAGTYLVPHGLRYKPQDILETWNDCGATINFSGITAEVLSITTTGSGTYRALVGRVGRVE